MTAFSDFYGDPSDIVQQMAHNLDTYTTQYQSGQISADEYKDLCDDATILDDVAKAGKTLGELELLANTIQVLKEIVEAVPIP